MDYKSLCGSCAEESPNLPLHCGGGDFAGAVGDERRGSDGGDGGVWEVECLAVSLRIAIVTSSAWSKASSSR